MSIVPNAKLLGLCPFSSQSSLPKPIACEDGVDTPEVEERRTTMRSWWLPRRGLQMKREGGSHGGKKPSRVDLEASSCA